MKTKTVGSVLNGLMFVMALIALTGCAATDQGQTDDSARKKHIQKMEQPQDDTEFDLPPHHFIRRGMSTSRITSLVGDPERKVQKSGRPDVWHYTFGLVMVEEERVQYKYPPSRSGNRKADQPLETGP